MKDVLVLRNLDEIKAISHPYRVEILEAFKDTPLSAKQLSEILGEPHAKINYHIKTLLNANILELVEEKIKSGIIEKYYMPKAKIVLVEKNILKSHYQSDLDSRIQNNITQFEKIREDFYNALESTDYKIEIIKNYNDILLNKKQISEIFDFISQTVENSFDEVDDEDKNIYSLSVMGILNNKKIEKSVD